VFCTYQHGACVVDAPTAFAEVEEKTVRRALTLIGAARREGTPLFLHHYKQTTIIHHYVVYIEVDADEPAGAAVALLGAHLAVTLEAAADKAAREQLLTDKRKMC
jgi:hypothetical protein